MGCGLAISFTLIFFGVLLLLENLGVANDLVARYWPAVLIILGIVGLLDVRRMRARFGRFRMRWPPGPGG
jgi:hypothetical protein